MAEADLDLTGKVLIAMPGMGDPRFEHSVVFMCAHSPEGAMGLIVNKPAPELSLAGVLKQLDIPVEKMDRKRPIHFGGPVEVARGFVLHTREYASRLQTLEVDETFGMSATVDTLENIAQGSGPKESLVMLGYSGWGPGQLEDEIKRNGWLTADASTDLIFGTDDSEKWAHALRGLGIDPLGLSAAAGRA